MATFLLQDSYDEPVLLEIRTLTDLFIPMTPKRINDPGIKSKVQEFNLNVKYISLAGSLATTATQTMPNKAKQ